MSDRTTSGKYDVLVEGDTNTKKIMIKFIDIGKFEIIDEFQTFVREEIQQLWPKPSNMCEYLDKRFNKSEGHFECEYPAIFKSALDRVSNELFGVDYEVKKTPEELRAQAIRVLFWVAFLAKHYDITEEPEIYSNITP